MPAGPAACGTNFCPLTLLTLLVKPAPPNANNAPTFPRIAPPVQPGDIYTCQSANAYYNAPLNITTMDQLGNAHPAHPPASTAQAQAQQASPALCASLAYSSQLTSTAPLPAHLSAPQLTSTIVTSAPNAPNCANCSSASSCTLCANGFYLYNGTCLSECPSGYYLSIASGLQSCEVCQLPCLTCSGYSTYCLTCNTSSILINKYLYTTLNSSICTNGCPLNFYFTEDLICQPCIPPCLSCSSPTSCSSCVPTYYFHSNTQACYLTCPNTTLALSSPFRC